MKTIKIILTTALLGTMMGCKKDFLDEKPNKALLIPETLSDFRAFLDNAPLMNVSPSLNIISSDDYINTGMLNDFASAYERNSYLWEQDIYSGSSVVPDWTAPYLQVLNANIVLDGLAKVSEDVSSSVQGKEVRGSALFYRSLAFYHLSQEFAEQFDVNTAKNVLGIPIRLEADINLISKRGSLLDTFQQIEKDLLEAFEVLPAQVNYKNRPSKFAAAGLLARLYLVMGNYSKAEEYSSLCLQNNNFLIDYNSLNPATAYPFPAILPNNNGEVLFYCLASSYSFFSSSETIASTELFSLYSANDLRKSLFFNDKKNFKGSYNGNRSLFTGIANDELYLIHAECLARKGFTIASMDELNALLVKRYKAGDFVSLSAANSNEALKLILNERRKELCSRGIRWSDLRRLNLDADQQISLSRTFSGQIYTLQPGSKRYVFPIPDDEIRLSGMEQNLR